MIWNSSLTASRIGCRRAVGKASSITRLAAVPRTFGTAATIKAPKAPPPPSSGSAGGASSSSSSSKKWTKTSLGGLALGLGAAQFALGDTTDFFEHQFVVKNKKSEDLADFYGSEDLMQIFSVFPFMADLMMRGAEFDDEGNIHARGLMGTGAMEVSIDFSEGEIDTTGDGEPDTIGWFNKREHFQDVAPTFLGGFTLWQMTQNFGYHRLSDGTCVVYHQGERFRGFFPVRLLFQLHAKYVIWATERYINSDAFGSEDLQEEAEEIRQNVPLHVFNDFINGLTKEVEKAQKLTHKDSVRHKELEVTIQRLKTVAEMDHSQETTLPRLHTLRTRKSHVGRVELILDDPETKDTIRTAMKQLGEVKGKRPQPVKEVHHLHRRTTMSAMKLKDLDLKINDDDNHEDNQ